jgi:hypothetical protein
MRCRHTAVLFAPWLRRSTRCSIVNCLLLNSLIVFLTVDMVFFVSRLYHNKVGDEGVSKIAKALETNTSLTTLT